MGRVLLGSTGLSVSKLCFGTLTMSPLQTDMSPRDGARLLLVARELGVRFVDTADLYLTYPHIREALKSSPDLMVSTKAYCYDEKTANEAVERAFRGLGREYVDVFMLHEQESIHTLRGHEQALLTLRKYKERGLIGAVGVSTHHVACVRAAATFGGIDVIHPIFNLAGLGVADGTRQEMEAAVARAHDMGIGILAMKPLGGGHLIDSIEDAWQYVRDAQCVDSIAVGMQTEDEIRANVKWCAGEAVDPELSARVKQRRRSLMIHDWCEGCGLCAKRCGQGALTVIDGRARVDRSKCVLCGYCAPVCPQFCIKVV